MFTKIKQILAVLIVPLLFIGVVLSTSPTTFAASCEASSGNICCGKAETSIIGGEACENVTDDGVGRQSGIWSLLLLILNIMTAGVGIAAVGGIAYGAVLYAGAGDKVDQTKKAIETIRNVVIGIIAYALMYLVLNFLIPGGIFSA